MVAYVSYFNKKYERVGHLFQDRYLSKQVETNEYVLDLQRYIHQNPEKAGIARKEKYQWSSYMEYINEKGVTDREYIMELLDRDIEAFKNYNQNTKYSIRLMQEFEMEKKLTDEEAKEMIQEILQIENLQEIQCYNKTAREKILDSLREKGNLSCAQIARVTGLNEKMMERYFKRSVPNPTKEVEENGEG